MKKIYLIMALLIAAGIGYGAAEFKMSTEKARGITFYTNASINRYDLGDTECFVETINHSMFCMRK